MMRIGMVPLIVAVFVACVSSSEPSSREGSIVLTGRIMVIGSEHLLRVLIVTDDQSYELVGDHSEALLRVQKRRVTVRGHVVRQARGLGRPARLEVEAYTVLDGEESTPE